MIRELLRMVIFMLVLKGESFDGNNFYADAFDKGAKACILDNTTLVDTDRYGDKTIILVDNTLECIGKLAKYKRSLLNIPVVAITGSVGKTSTKDMVASVLSTKYKVLKLRVIIIIILVFLLQYLDIKMKMLWLLKWE